jgi:hypothetical protein
MMFLDCPAYLDDEGALRCGLPAEVRSWFTMRSGDGPVEAAMIWCPSGHWFNGPIESLTWQHAQELEANSPAAAARSGTIPCDARPHRGAGPADRYSHRQPEQDTSRPNAAPAYYLGRPAWLWLSGTKPRRRPTPLAATQTRTGCGTQLAKPAGGGQPEPSRAIPQTASALR